MSRWTERRRERRLPVSIRVWVVETHVQRYARLVDVHPRGARVRTRNPPAVDSECTLRFKMPDGSQVEATGRVMWRELGSKTKAGAFGTRFDQVLGRASIEAYAESIHDGSN